MLCAGDDVYQGGLLLEDADGDANSLVCWRKEGVLEYRQDYKPKLQGNIWHMQQVGNYLYVAGEIAQVGDTLVYNCAQLYARGHVPGAGAISGTGALSAYLAGGAAYGSSEALTALAPVYAAAHTPVVTELTLPSDSNVARTLRLRRGTDSLGGRILVTRITYK